MKKMQDIANLSEAELNAKLKELKQERLNLRIQQQSGQLERPSRLNEIRKMIARMKTKLTQLRLKAAV